MENSNIENIYSTITKKGFFEKEILNNESEFYYYFKIQEFTKHKNKLLLNNRELKHRYEVLSVFNNQLQTIMFEIIVLYKLVIECKKINKKLHFDGLKIRLNSKLEYINTSFIPTIRYNYDDNHLLGYKMNEYCINAFSLMFDKLENEFMIDIKKSPLFSTIENVYNKYLYLFDVEKMKVLSIPITETQPTPTVPAPENKNPFPLIFTGNDDKAYNVFMDLKKNVTDYYPDYSFIFQKMKGKSEMLIEKRCRHKEFMDWLFENKHISETVYIDFIDKESFSTKYDRGMRATQYNSIKEKYFPINSDLSE